MSDWLVDGRETAGLTKTTSRFLAFSAVILLLAACAFGTEDPCASKTVFALPTELGFGECARFSNEVDTSYCREIVAEDQSVGWFEYLLTVGDQTVGFQCRNDNSALSHESGYVEGSFSQLVPPTNAGGNWKVTDFPVPDLGYLSNPIVCGSTIAYWRLVDGNLSTVVFDAAKQEVVSRESVGWVLVETDNRFIFPAPEWGALCRSVRFQLVSGLLRPLDRVVTITG